MTAEAVPAPRSGWRWVRRAVLALVALLAAPYLMVLVYLVGQPPSTAMIAGWLTGAPVDRRWVPLSEISPNLVRAVITSEDARFCLHWGIDLGAIRDALRRAEQRADGSVRGTSTISMQTAKNVFLWNDRSIVRKVLELPLAVFLDLVWSKERVIEVYLNVAQWGPNLYGAEAAARHHFGVPARDLSLSQALLLATALPNPIRRVARTPGALHRRLADRLRARVERQAVDFSCLPRLAAQ